MKKNVRVVCYILKWNLASRLSGYLGNQETILQIGRHMLVRFVYTNAYFNNVVIWLKNTVIKL